MAHSINRWLKIRMQNLFYYYCKNYPEKVKQGLLKGVEQYLGPDFDIDTHFTPAYKRGTNAYV